MHYYQHHIGDLIKDTANLNDHQLATYLRMLWSYYSEEKPLTNELEDLAFAMRSDEKTVRLLLRHYFKECSDGWRHSRCDREIAEFHGKKDKAAASANARWKNAKNKPNAMRTQCERNANASVLDANQEPRTNNQEEDQEHLSPAGNDADASAKKITYSEIQKTYNAICSPVFPACAVMNDKRKRQIKAMGSIEFMGAKPFTQGIEVWQQYFTDCLANPHWKGQNDSGWRADFDFVTKPQNAIKLMERMN